MSDHFHKHDQDTVLIKERAEREIAGLTKRVEKLEKFLIQKGIVSKD